MSVNLKIHVSWALSYRKMKAFYWGLVHIMYLAVGKQGVIVLFLVFILFGSFEKHSKEKPGNIVKYIKPYGNTPSETKYLLTSS